ncbi:MAG: RHS repeat-associated core domain-containing protein [Blastocatellia bacterium]
MRKITHCLLTPAQTLIVKMSCLGHALNTTMRRLSGWRENKMHAVAPQHARHIHWQSISLWRRAISLMLCVVLLANPILAMPQGVLILSNEFRYSLAFYWYNSGLAAKFNAWFQKPAAVQDTRGWDGKGAPPNTPPEPSVQEKQANRDVKVSKIEISPRDVTIHTGEKAVFAAVAYDKDGNLVPGVKFIWDGSDEDRKRKMSVSPRGIFTSPVPGNYKVTVEALNKRDSVKVTVIGEKLNPKDPGVKGEPISTSDKPKAKISRNTIETPMQRIGGAAPTVPDESNLLKKTSATELAQVGRKGTRYAAKPMAVTAAVQGGNYDYYQWNGGNYTEADDPGRERGDMAGHAADGGAGSGNFQFSAPITGLDGRGIDLNLVLNYNSRIWHKSGSDMYFDIDGDYIPGWTFGFGRIVTAGNGYMLIEADGTRHSYGGNPWSYSAPNTSLQGFDGYTKDGSYINYWARGYRPQYGSYILDAWAKLPNGTKIIYGASANLGAYPTQITDANGNYITITYVNNQGPQIDTITDTLGRQIKFKYVDLLVGSVYKKVVVAVTVPGFNGGADRVIARYAYDTKSLTDSGSNYGFSGVTCRVQNATIARLKAIYYPATNTGYWFGDSDSYSTYGMLRKISERRGMACSNPDVTTAEANITNSGVMSREVVYEHTSQAGYSNTSGPLTDVPTYNQTTEDWSGRHASAPHNIPKPVTEYNVTTNSSTITTRITRRDTSSSDGLTTEQITDNNTSSQTYGLLLEDTTFPTKTSSTVLHKSKVYWEVPDLNTYPSHYGAPRPNHTEVTDERGQMTSTYYTYGVNYNQVADVREYGYNNQFLRRTHTDYINTTPYIGYWSNNPYGSYFGRHIYSLVSAVSVYASENDDSVRVSRTEYQYDQQSGQQLYNTPDVPQHELVSDPYDPGYQICDWVWNGWDYDYICNTYYTYDSGTDKRGNITSVKRYADALNVPNDPLALTETRNYDICGNLITAAPACCEQTVYTYSIDTKYTWPSSVTHGLISDASQRNTISTVYDLNTGLVTTAYNPNGLYSTTTYNASTLRPTFEYGFRSSSSQPVGYTYHEYYDNTSNNDMAIIDFSYESGLNGASWANRVDKYLDGKGRVGAEIGFTAGYEMDVVATIYDQFGRVKTQSRPYRLNTSWGLVGTQEWTNFNYDVQDRITSEVAPDGSISYRYYNETSYPSGATPGGQTIRLKDAWGRERWARSDEQNRLVEVVEPAPNGDGTVASNGLITTYSYNTLGNLTGVNQGGQTRSFKFDSLGRMTNQKLAERQATLTDSGGDGSTWSDYFKYDNRGNLIQRIDARRVKTNFDYGSDPLNRLQSVSYDKSNALDATNIKDAATVSYTYENTSSKDKTRLLSISLTAVNGLPTDFGNQSFGYDSEGRLSSLTQKYGNSRNATTSYEYDTLGRTKKIFYPAQQGQTGNPIREGTLTYDLASRSQSLTYNSTAMANNPVYNPSSQTTQLDVGGAIQEQYTFDPQTGLLTNQKVKQGSTTHMDLSYDYNNLYTGTGQNSTWKTGQLSKIVDNKNNERNRQFTYDKLSRLKEAKGGSSFTLWSQTYSYDNWGNRTGVAGSGFAATIPANTIAIGSDGLTSVTYDTATNRITSGSFSYDAAGNQTQANENGLVNNYKYDTAGRLAEVTNNAGTHTYAYGTSNQRLQSVEGSNTTLYTWEGGSVIAEYNGAGTGMTWTKSYVYLGARLLAVESPLSVNSTEIQYQHPDRLGTRLVTNTAGGIVSENIGLPFGNIIAGESTNIGGSATKKRFTTYDRSDTTTLDYAVNRNYSAAQGRFTQVDPIGINASSLENPQSLNLYAYVGNDPINRTDPDGLFWKEIGNFFKKVGKFFSKVGEVIGRVLNNRWVRIGVFLLGFFMPGLKLISAALAKVVNVALKVYNFVADVGAQLQLYGMLFQGKFKELGLSLANGLVGNAISNLIDPIIGGVQKALFDPKFDELADLFVGGWKGFKQAWQNLGNSFGQKVFNLMFGYGNYGGAGHPPDGAFDPQAGQFNPDTPGIDSVDNRFKGHDKRYRTAGYSKLKADVILVGGLFFSSPRLHASDIAFSGQFRGRPGSGSVYKFVATAAFTGMAIGRGTAKAFK